MERIFLESPRYTFSACEKESLSAVMDFFGREWDSTHRLATNRQYIEDYFYDRDKGNYNFLLAYDKSDQLVGLLGFVGNDFYDREIEGGDRFIWLTNWLVSGDAQKGLGIQLLSTLGHCYRTQNIGTIGNNQVAGAIYRTLGYQTGQLGQYLIANHRIRRFKLLRNYENNLYPPTENSAAAQLSVIRELDALTGNKALQNVFDYFKPRKSITYLKNKYAKSNAYAYHIYGIESESDIQGLIIFRTVEHDGARALRIVEYVGFDRHLKDLGRDFQKLLTDFDAEYLDFYSLNDPPKDCGFVLNTGQNGLIVPDYYEPYRQMNVEMRYAYFFLNERTRICRGDGDREFKRGE